MAEPGTDRSQHFDSFRAACDARVAADIPRWCRPNGQGWCVYDNGTAVNMETCEVHRSPNGPVFRTAQRFGVTCIAGEPCPEPTPEPTPEETPTPEPGPTPDRCPVASVGMALWPHLRGETGRCYDVAIDHTLLFAHGAPCDEGPWVNDRTIPNRCGNCGCRKCDVPEDRLRLRITGDIRNPSQQSNGFWVHGCLPKGPGVYRVRSCLEPGNVSIAGDILRLVNRGEGLGCRQRIWRAEDLRRRWGIQ